MVGQRLKEIYELLFSSYGAQHWWPGDGRFEMIAGAILVQNTNWGNTELAIENLKAAGCLDAKKVFAMDTSELAGLIRPAGYYNVKAGRLKNFLGWLFENYDGDLSRLEGLDSYSLREELLGVKGIGRETADSILLYAFQRPVFVVDSYTCRVLFRHRLIDAEAGYEQVREFFESNLAADVALFNEFHALFVRVGKEHCKVRPKCAGCPLESLEHEVEMEF
ncbi:MAG: endonuclease III domain-containing protein [Planctomycetes bacterium]|nr:endonuclease III domain-containing protein [Planctomycetota bacterium]